MALLLHRKKSDYWSGAILAAPMCKVRNLFRTCHVRALTYALRIHVIGSRICITFCSHLYIYIYIHRLQIP